MRRAKPFICLGLALTACLVFASAAEARPAAVTSGIAYNFKTQDVDYYVSTPININRVTIRLDNHDPAGITHGMSVWHRYDHHLLWVYHSRLRFHQDRCYGYQVRTYGRGRPHIFSAVSRAKMSGLNVACKAG